MIRVSGLLIEDMRTAVCIRFCVAAKEGGAGRERSVLPEGTKRQRVARRQDASEANLQPMPEFMTAWATTLLFPERK